MPSIFGKWKRRNQPPPWLKKYLVGRTKNTLVYNMAPLSIKDLNQTLRDITKQRLRNAKRFSVLMLCINGLATCVGLYGLQLAGLTFFTGVNCCTFLWNWLMWYRSERGRLKLLQDSILEELNDPTME